MNRPFQLTEEQEDVVHHPEGKFSVVAAAGSGKTRVLTERYIQLIVERGYDPSTILTITFTRKAAEEMKERIVEALEGYGLRREAQIAETGPIQTIHSFCETTLREQAVLAGLDPRFEIVTSPETDILFEAAVREVFEEDLAERSHWLAYLRLNSGKGVYNGPAGIDSGVIKELSDVLGKLRGSLWARKDFARLFRSPDQVLDRWKKEVAAKSGIGIDPNLNLSEMRTIIAEKLKRGKPSWSSKAIDDEQEYEAAVHTCALAQIAERVWAVYERALLDAQRLDYSLLEHLAVKLVCDEPSARAELARTYKAVLVDESQDLNPVQYRLLEQLKVPESMMVGDPQQSIYSFRQADPSLFRGPGQAVTLRPADSELEV